jgi:hypothetical protein
MKLPNAGLRGLTNRGWLVGLFLLLCVTSLVGASQAPTLELRQEPGFVDLETFGEFDPEAIKLEINLGGALLRLLGSAVEEEDGEFAQLLRGLRSIQVVVYDAEESRAREAAGQIRSVIRDLQKNGWESVVTLRDEGSMNLLVRSNDELILGLLAAFTDDEGSVGFLNIVGDFDPVQIGRLARQLDLQALDGLDLDALEDAADKPENEEREP